MASSAAPADLSIIQDFLNTVRFDQASDSLGEGDALPAWCARTEYCSGADRLTLADLRRFREALREVLGARTDPQAADRWRALEPFAGRAGYRMHIMQAGLPALRPQGCGADSVIAHILRIVYDAVRDGTWPRLKACRKQTCRRAFYDTSKNGSGAWCSMRVCGNRAKAERRRAREKSHETR